MIQKSVFPVCTVHNPNLYFFRSSVEFCLFVSIKQFRICTIKSGISSVFGIVDNKMRTAACTNS